MISYYAPSVRAISDELYYLERFRSLIHEISYEVEMIFISETHTFTERDEFIVASMDITDKEGTLVHASDTRKNQRKIKRILPESSGRIY